MKNVSFFLALCVFAWLGCKSDGSDGVQEIRGGDGPNSALIRNPVSADIPLDTNKLARISYTEETYNFGEVLEGTVVEHTFQFKNTGKVPLTILNARSSCGCTIPEWPKEQIPPGGSGAISAKFNTEGKSKDQRKWVYVTANTYPNETKVLLEGMVLPN